MANWFPGRVLAATGVALVSLLASLTVSFWTPAEAMRANPGDILVNQPDPVGDVKLFNKHHGPSKAMRRSVDLLGFSVVVENGGVQMTVKLKRILSNVGYDQVVEVQMTPSDTGLVWFDDVTMSGQEPTESYASYSPSLDGSDLQSCGPLTAQVDPTTRTVSLFVPDMCLPETAAKIKVFSSLGHYRAEGVGYSLDRMKITGVHVLQ